MDTDLIIFSVVVLTRLLLPLTIPRYPLPGVLACLVLDAIDQSIFQRFTTVNLEGYQSYDKALDIYYLSVAYISTLRNWTNLFAFKASRFLLYYRLVGVTLFEMTGIRALLLIFPNTFEYFFIFYHTVSLRWNPLRYSKKFILYSIAFIWIFIKLPQEYWIHIAKLDVTETLNKYLFKMPADTPMGEAILANMGITITLALLAIGLIVLARWVVIHKLPPADVRPTLRADMAIKFKPIANHRSLLFEKVILVGLVSVIFSFILPGLSASMVQLFIAVGLIIAANSYLRASMERRSPTSHTRSLSGEFLVMILLNAGIVVGLGLLLPQFDRSAGWEVTSFFLFLITVLVTLFDRYMPVHQSLFKKEN